MTIYDFNPYSLPDAYLKAIGLVIASSSQTEEILGHFLGGLLGADNIETAALHTHMSFPMKNDIVRSILELNAQNASSVDEVDDILDRIEKAVRLRNEVAHNKFAIHPETGEVYSFRVKARGSLQSNLTIITVQELLETAE